jgi:hypothetical protein
MTTQTQLEPIERPDGRLYQPRKLAAHAVSGEDDFLSGVVVFGTHDPANALPLAAEYVTRQLGKGYAPAGPRAVWWRDGFESGHRCWLDDDRAGRAGVWFREIVEAPESSRPESRMCACGTTMFDGATCPRCDVIASRGAADGQAT